MLIFGCGVLIDLLIFPYNKFPFVAMCNHLQLTGVLQKIAVCYLLAFLLYRYTGPKGVILGIVGLNLAYIGLLFWFPVPGCGPGVLTPECNFPRWIDELLLHKFNWDVVGMQDPDGLGTVLTSVSSVLFGVLIGRVIRSESGFVQRVRRLLAGGVSLLLAGILLSVWVPFNKQMWTTSYAVFMAGLASMCFCGLVWLIDIHRLGRWFRPFEILGLNAISACLFSRLIVNVPKVHFYSISLYDDVLCRLTSPNVSSMLFAILILLVVFLFVWRMYHFNLLLKV